MSIRRQEILSYSYFFRLPKFFNVVSLPPITARVSQLGSTSGGTIWRNGQKLHENDKIGIFGSKQWGGQANFSSSRRDTPSPPPARGNPDSCYIDLSFRYRNNDSSGIVDGMK